MMLNIFKLQRTAGKFLCTKPYPTLMPLTRSIFIRNKFPMAAMITTVPKRNNSSYVQEEIKQAPYSGRESIELIVSRLDQDGLKEFCHYYQIPFIENNLVKTTYNAAKIYYRLKENDIKVPISQTKIYRVSELLATIPKEEVEDLDTKFKMEDKWMKFFMPRLTSIEIDIDKALSTVYTENPKGRKYPVQAVLKAFIRDNAKHFNDSQKLRALSILESNQDRDMETSDFLF